MIATRKAVEQAIATLYGSEGTVRAMEEMKREAGETSGDIVPAQMAHTADTGADAAPTIRFVNSVIERAVHERASDIHLEPQADELVVRMRVDGLLRRVLTVPTNLQATAIPQPQGHGRHEHRRAQDPAGRSRDGARQGAGDRPAYLVHAQRSTAKSSAPRLLDKSQQHITSRTIGLEGDDLTKYNALLKNTSGVILLVGPTGSGKSTTLCAMLKELCSEQTKIMSPGKTRWSMTSLVREPVPDQRKDRHDVCRRAARDPAPRPRHHRRGRNSGRRDGRDRHPRRHHGADLVLSTLHTNDAVAAVDRLLDIGVEPYLIANALRGVISQRLVRRICPHCKTAYRPEADELELLGLPEDADVEFYRGTGCEECYHTGTSGRRAVFEILTVDARLRRMIAEGARYDELYAAARQTNFETLRERCRSLSCAAR